MKRLKFSQYFIDTSDDFNHTGKARYKIDYKVVPYTYKGFPFEANYEIHYEADRNVIQINFQATNGNMDWVTNLLFTQKYYDSFIYNGKKITLRVHNGWAAMYKAMKHLIRDRVNVLLHVNPTAEIEIIGWSLGSGQAQLCAQDIFYNFGRKVNLYTYGSVNPWKTNIFNRRKIKRYLRECCNDCYNFSNVNDFVTYLPPRLFGFIKIKRRPVGRPFIFWKLFNIRKYHTTYDDESLYTKYYKH